MTEPKRIQLRRTKGWRKPQGAIVVARPGPWGNPYRATFEDAPHVAPPDRRAWAAGQFRRDWLACLGSDNDLRERLHEGPDAQVIDLIRKHLGGHDLACWCPLTDNDGNPVPCHADVLLELANPTLVAPLGDQP